MSDLGFADSDAAERDMQEIRAMMRTAAREDAGSKIQALVNLIDQRIEAHSQQAASGPRRGIALAAQNVYRRLCRAVGHDLGGKDMAQNQILDRRDVVLELGKIIFGYGHLDLQLSDLPEPTRADLATHRLSETSK